MPSMRKLRRKGNINFPDINICSVWGRSWKWTNRNNWCTHS